MDTERVDDARSATRTHRTVSRRGILTGGAGTAATALLASLAVASAPEQSSTATPGTVVDGPGSLAAMLGRIPADLPGLDDPERAWVSYAAVATQLATVGVVADPEGDDTSLWFRATIGMAFPSESSGWLRSDWRATFGFSALHVDQTFEVASPPFWLTLLRGSLDPTEVRTALERSGYRSIDFDGATFMSAGDDGEWDPDSAIGQLARFGSMNQASILDDGTLVFASHRATLRAVLEVEAGGAAALGDRVDLAMLARSVWPDLASGVIVPGMTLIGETLSPVLLLTPDQDVDALATLMAEAGNALRRMPPVVSALVGFTAGGPVEQKSGSDGSPTPPPLVSPPAHAVVELVMLNETDAVAAVSIIEERLVTLVTSKGERFSDLFPEQIVRSVPGTPVVLVELSVGPETHRLILIALLERRDLGFIYWSP